MDTTPLAAQLIGEEPRFDVVLQNAVSNRLTTLLSLYDLKIIRSNVFYMEKLFDRISSLNQSIRIR